MNSWLPHLISACLLFTSAMCRTLPSQREKSYSKFDRKCSLPQEVACNYESCFKTPELSATLENITADPWPATEFHGFVHVEGAESQGDCCWSCATTLGCKYWLWSPNEKKACRHAMDKDVNFLKCSKSGHKTLPMMGGKCNPMAGYPKTSSPLTSDEKPLEPRFNPFDTVMDSATSVCMLTTRSFHLNSNMRGYWFEPATTKQGEMKAKKMGKNFAHELGFVWEKDGMFHRTRFEARKGVLGETGKEISFLRHLEVDGSIVRNLPWDRSTSFPGGLSVKRILLDQGEKVESFHIVIAGIVEMQVQLRKADEILQTEKDDFAHFVVLLDSLKGEEGNSVSGMLGEVYNEVMKSTVLEKVTKTSGREHVFSDFVSSSVLKPDCPASTFKSSSSYKKISSF